MKLTTELLLRHDRPGPRYTSYPTAVDFTEEFDQDRYGASLDSAAANVDGPLSLYVHLPFCEARCSFCACHVVVTKSKSVAEAYLGRIGREAALVAERLGGRRRLVQYHWGGGTPTHYDLDALLELHATILGDFELADDAEVALEVDPRVTTKDHLAGLRQVGFNRISLGVQDLDPDVQRLIGRDQTLEQTVDLHEAARRLGYRSVNFDLIYGLPGQSADTLGETLEEVIRLEPDRLAVYSFAYVPWMRPSQKRLDATLLPGTEAKFAMLAQVVSTLTDAGYRHIGMDHFAVASDELAMAAEAGTLTRNFMGYTTKRDTDVVALGTSGISDVSGAYAQNHRRLASYYEAVDAGQLPTERGYLLDEDDMVRRHVITELMCNQRIDFDAVGRRFSIDALAYFDLELEILAGAGGLVEDGMCRIEGNVLGTSELGSFFVRSLAAVFDAHTGHRPTDRPVFSRTV